MCCYTGFTIIVKRIESGCGKATGDDAEEGDADKKFFELLPFVIARTIGRSNPGLSRDLISVYVIMDCRGHCIPSQ